MNRRYPIPPIDGIHIKARYFNWMHRGRDSGPYENVTINCGKKRTERIVPPAGERS